MVEDDEQRSDSVSVHRATIGIVLFKVQKPPLVLDLGRIGRDNRHFLSSCCAIGPSDRGEWPVLNSVSGLFCQWRTNVSLVFSTRRMLLASSAAAPSNETRIAQAPVAERPVALPPRNQGADALCHCYSNHCYPNHCYSNHHHHRALSAAPRLS